jgi:hypothetical protein
MCNNPEIINLPIKEILKLDNGTSQWASASVLLGSKEKIENSPNKLRLTYEAVKHWNHNETWKPRYDPTIERQAQAFLNLLKTKSLNFTPKHSEDYCFARAFDLITPDIGKKKFPSIIGHETNRITEMEKAISQAESNQAIDSKDHRVVQAIVMRQISKSKPYDIVNKNCVNKTWPQFWDFISSISLNTSPA